MKVSPSILDRIGQTPMVRLHRVAAHLPVPVLADLVERGVVAGVKDSSTNLTGFRQLVLAGGGRADVAYFSGSDGLLDAALQVGANGSVAGLANVAPELFVAALRAHRSGDAAALAAVAKSYRVYYKKVPLEGGDYTMDHTAVVYLMDKEGWFVQPFNMRRTADVAAADLRRHL